MSPAERLKVLLFLALFFGAIGFLFTLLSCGTEYWLLAAESCSRPEDSCGGRGLREGKSSTEAIDGVRIFHEGLFWRCSFMALSNEYSIWDLWICKNLLFAVVLDSYDAIMPPNLANNSIITASFPSANQPPSKVCQAAFLFPFPVNEPLRSWVEPHGLPTEPYEHHSAIVFRTFWSIFLVTGLTAIAIGGFVVICAGPLANHKLYKVGGALQLCGGLCLLAVVVMYLMWVQVLDTLDQFARHQRVSSCPFFHLSIQHGPSFLLAPVAVFFCLLAGLLFILVGRSIRGLQLDKRTELAASDV